MLQLDANLIEGEPYNRLAQENKRRLNVARQNSNISEMWETGFKNPPRQTPSVWGLVVSLTLRFFRVGQKSAQPDIRLIWKPRISDVCCDIRPDVRLFSPSKIFFLETTISQQRLKHFFVSDFRDFWICYLQ